MGDFMPHARPGKTAPRLIRDLVEYDPRRSRPEGKKNLLTDPPPIYRPGGKLHPLRTLPNDCLHQLWQKDEQTLAPLVNEKPSTSSKYISSSYCGRCLYHFDVLADFTRRPGKEKPCHFTSIDYPLHHFQHYESRVRTEKESVWDKFDNYKEIHSFFCTAPGCPCVVDIRISPPRLTRERLLSIWDPARVFRRGQKAIQEQPERYPDTRPLNPVDVLTVLRTYLIDALRKDPAEKKRIAVRNKKFLLAFSNECDEIFEYLDFTVELVPNADDEGHDKFWVLPAVDTLSDDDFGVRSRRQFIDDAVWELSERISEASSTGDAGRMQGRYKFSQLSAINDIYSTLGCLGYTRLHRAINLDDQEDEHPHYVSLGTVNDFADDLISYAYDRQRECDPQNSPYYLECLQGIATGRGSVDLQEKSVIAFSMGEHTLTDIDNAYKFFTIDPDTKEGDEHIIGLYRSRIESAPRQKDEAKKSLLIIGEARQSPQIQAVANDKEMSHEEALEYLSVVHDTPSDSIEAVAIAMAVDGDKEKVARALRVIGQHRNQWSLELFANQIESGDSSGAVNVAEAYRRLQIGDPNMRDESVITYYQSLCAGAPSGSKDSFTEALRTIATSRNSALLKAHIDNPNALIVVEKGTADQPVGLDNIGNTCYLNSLLQYYYTVKPVRDVVMNFDDYRMVLNTENLLKKRVGGRRVDRSEIVKAQKFVEELRNLFENLKSASTKSVKPTQDLAELTLFSAATEANFRRASISSPRAPNVGLASYLDAPVYGPHLPPPPPVRQPPIPVVVEEDIEMVDPPSTDSVDQEDASSDATLVDLEPSAATDIAIDNRNSTKNFNKDKTAVEDQVIELSANEPEYLVVSAEIEKEAPVTVADESAQKPNFDSQGDEIMINGSSVVSSPSTILPSPEKPPPVPPRNKPAPISTSRQSEDSLRAQRLDFGAQQDVTEVIGNVMFRLQCAITPTSIDPKFGEQIDGIRETFFGANAVYLKKAETYDVKIEDWANIIVYPSPDGPRSIYEALDVVFDEQEVEIDNKLTTQYASISKLPPVFQTQIQRTAFDPKTQQASKNQNAIVFEETIYLDRYMDSDKVMQRRRDAWKWKKRLRELEARQKKLQTKTSELDVPESMNILKDFLVMLQEQEIDGITVAPSIIEGLEMRRIEVLQELDAIAAETTALKQKLQDQFTDMREHRYRLQAVFIHRGTSTHGHYWIYIYDFPRDIWREYNDAYVSVVSDRKRIFDQSANAGATPYYLVYVRDQDKDELVDAICREIAEEEEEPKQEQVVAAMDRNVDQEDVIELGNGVQHIEDVDLVGTSSQSQLASHDLVGMGGWDTGDGNAENTKW